MKQKNTTLENEIEAYLVRSVQALGGLCVKMDTVRGFPDRLVLLPHGVMAFAETKRPRGGRVSSPQLVQHEFLRRLGFRVFILRTKEEVDEVIELLMGFGSHGPQ